MARIRHGSGLELFLLAVLLQACAPVTVVPVPDNGQEAAVVRVVDGDTIELAGGRTVRYIGINTPEQGQPFHQEAKQANRQLVEGKTVLLTLDAQVTDRFGRLLAYVWVDDHFVNQELLSRGYANAYTEPPNVRYSAELVATEHEARRAEVGLWKPAGVQIKISNIQYNAPGADDQNPNGEWLELRNEGSQTVDLTSFLLKDEATHVYTLPDVSLGPNRMLRIYSGRGTDSADSLHWGLSNDAVWDNSGDTAYLWDARGRLVDTYSYP